MSSVTRRRYPVAGRLQSAYGVLEVALANEEVIGVEGGEHKDRDARPRQGSRQRREDPDQREVEWARDP
jgi:hypothetical protein